MGYLVLKAVISGIVIAIASEVARRWPGLGALIVSLPLVSILAMIWLWRDTGDTQRLADHSTATFFYVLPLFLLVPFLLRQGLGFWPAIAAGCVLTAALYLGMVMIAPRFGIEM